MAMAMDQREKERIQARKKLFKSLYSEERGDDFYALESVELSRQLSPVEEEYYRVYLDVTADTLFELRRMHLVHEYSDSLKRRLDRGDEAFNVAVQTMRHRLRAFFPLGVDRLLSSLPRKFILLEDESFSAETMHALKLVFSFTPQSFWASHLKLKTVDDFLDQFQRAFPSLCIPMPTTSSGIDYDSDTKLLTITSRKSAFHPTKTLLMRESYWAIIRELTDCSAAVVLGDPGTGSSSLLRVMFELFAHQTSWPQALINAAIGEGNLLKNATDAKPFSEYDGIFWIMESGKYQFAMKEPGTQSIVHGEGLYGRGGDDDLWRRRGVLLLVDGVVSAPFQAKISNVFVFSTPRPANYHRMMKASNAVTLTLSPWSKEELQYHLAHGKSMVWKTMFPYFKRIRAKVYGSGESGGDENVEDDVLDEGMDEADRDVLETNEDRTILVAKSAFSTWEYDEEFEFERLVKSSDASTSELCTTTAWHFLTMHILRRFELVGGRIQVLLNPSETFVTLKRFVKSAVYSVSIKTLQHQRWIESPQEEPSVAYSLVPSSADLRDPATTQFASTAISCFVLGRLYRLNSDGIVQFLTGDTGRSIFGSVLRGMLGSYSTSNAGSMRQHFETCVEHIAHELRFTDVAGAT